MLLLSLLCFLKIVSVLDNSSFYLWVDSVFNNVDGTLVVMCSKLHMWYLSEIDRKFSITEARAEEIYFRRSIWENFVSVKGKSMRTNFITFSISRFKCVCTCIFVCVCMHARGRWKERNNIPSIQESSEALQTLPYFASSIFASIFESITKR